AAGPSREGAASRRGPAGALPISGQQAAPIGSAGTLVPAGVLVPDLSSPSTRAESDGGGEALPSGATGAEHAAGAVAPTTASGAPVNPEAPARAGEEARGQGCDACSADGS